MREFRFKSWMIGILRRASYRYPPRNQALAAARVERGVYMCNVCKRPSPRKMVQVDHIEPVVNPERGFQGWDEYVARMFPGVEGYQVLCKPCHLVKSKGENDSRRANKKAIKGRTRKSRVRGCRR